MLFNSAEFLCFFPVVVLVYFVIPKKIRYIWLLAASLYFYMSWNVKYVFLLLFSITVTYVCGLALQKIRDGKAKKRIKKRRMRLCVAASLVLNLGVLFCFKYLNWMAESLGAALEAFHIQMAVPRFDILLPVGISFYTFQALGYTIDVFRGEIRAEKNPLKYALFVSFFPQLVAGPIERSKNLLHQFDEAAGFDWKRVKKGLGLMLWGFFLKLVIADRAALYVNTVFDDPRTYPGMFLAVAALLFAFQIYCDFSGYSIIAKGTALILGISLMDNFKAPYFSRSVGEFWHNWHISLSGWFRDYLYIPLGGNRKGRVRKALNVMIVFCLSGLWHGAAWNFLIWGCLNGIYQVLEDLIRPVIRAFSKSRILSVVQVLVTFFLVDFAWIFFRAENLPKAMWIIKSIFTMDNQGILRDGSLYTAGLVRENFLILLLAILLLLLTDFVGLCWKKAWAKLSECPAILYWAGMLALFWVVFMLGIYGVDYEASAFIYFQF